MKTKISPSLLTIIAIISVASLARIFTPIPNFTPIAAIALFGAAYINKKSIAFLIPIVILTITNFFLPVFDTLTTISIYSAFILSGVIGLWIGKNVSTKRVVIGAIASSVVFFILTNLAAWLWLGGLGFYSMNTEGLILCYQMALPFFRNELLGTLVYSGVLFGLYEYSKQRFPAILK